MIDPITAASIGSAALSTAGSLFGMFGDEDTPQYQAPPPYNSPGVYSPGIGEQMTPLAQAGTLSGQFYNAADAYPVQNYPAQNYDAYRQAAYGVVNNPYFAQAMGGAQQVAGLGQQAGQQQFGAGGALMGMSDAAIPYATQILQTGFDPQNALRAREEQRLTDQTQAALNRTGVGSSPYGGGIMGQTLGNFGLDWQDRALGRMNTAAGGYNTLAGRIGQGYGQGAALQNLGMGTLTSSAQLPYQTSIMGAQNSMGALDALNRAGAQTWALPQQAFNNLGALATQQRGQLGLGLNDAQFAANYGMRGADMANAFNVGQSNTGFNREQTYGSNLGQGIAGLGGGFQNIFGGGGGDTTSPGAGGGIGWNTPSDPYGLWNIGGFGG